MAPAQGTLGVWARVVNDAGGINGRRVKVLSVDDGNDPARNQAIVKDLVEHRKVIAFIDNNTPITVTASRAYLEEKRIPVVGGDAGSPEWNESPVFFPQGTSVGNLSVGTAKNAIAQGNPKLGLVRCVEAPPCTNGPNQFMRGVKRYGGNVVYEGQISIAQPDFTSECLQAKSRGVQAVTLYADANTYIRFAASCARQGFKPVFNALFLMATAKMEVDPNLQGMTAVQPVFPWVMSDSQPANEFRTAMQRYGASVELSAAATLAWTAGKLLEKALANTTEVTTESIFRGLWSLKDETLDGLTVPLNFPENRPASEARCFFLMKVVDGKWTTPQGEQQDCVD